MWMDHLFSYDMNLDKWLSKFRLGRKYRNSIEKSFLFLTKKKPMGVQRIKNLKQRPAQSNSVCLLIKVCRKF